MNNTQIKTTLNKILWELNPPEDSCWFRLCAEYKMDDKIPFKEIVEKNGMNYALWCCAAEPQHSKDWRLFAVWCARQVQHLMTDSKSRAALDVAERHANGQTSDEELAAAMAAAMAAARAALADGSVTYNMVWTTCLERGEAAALQTAWAAARAAEESGGAAAGHAARDAQKAEFLRVVGGTE